MFRGRKDLLELAKKPNSSIRICKRYLRQQTVLHNEKQPGQDSNPGKSSPEKPLSPIEAFRLRFSDKAPPIKPIPSLRTHKAGDKAVSHTEALRSENQQEPHAQHETLPTQESSVGSYEGESISLGQLADAYRRTGAPREYVKRDAWIPEQGQNLGQTSAEDVDEAGELAELSRLDEEDFEIEDGELFAGEITRDYQGVIPLNGEEYVKQKFPIKQGALVETRGEFTNLGIVITDKYLESHQLCYAVNNRGRLFICRPSSVDLVLPNFAPLDKVQRIDEILGTRGESTPKRPERIPPTPEGNEQEFNEILNYLTLKLHHIKLEADNAMRSVRQNDKSLYQILKHEDPTRTTSVFTPDVAQMLFKTEDPTYAELYATHKLLADDKVHFVPDLARHVETATFLVRANRVVLLVSRVANWIRLSSTELESFLDKSRKLISISRSLPKTLVPKKLNVEVPSELYFNGNDRHIIDFITAYVTGRKGFISPDLLALAPLVLNRTGMYPSNIVPKPDRNAAKLFLTEIGVWQPSESIPSQTDAGMSMQKLYQEQTVTETFGDSNSGFRHDFGEMPVYTIDDAGAHELDDGISIEETDQGKWLHIHIANPSAFIPPHSHIASLARLRQTTLYLPDKVHPMLPIQDEKFSAKGFSKDSQVMSTMTFSVRLANDGNIADFKVRPGLVRNVKILTYNDVDNAIFPDEKRDSYSWWTPSYIKPDYKGLGKEFDTISPEIKAHLRAIEDTIQTHRDWRTKQGALRMTYHNGSVQVNPKPLEWGSTTAKKTSRTDRAALRKTVPTFIRGNAGVKINIGDQGSRARSLIEETMIIAGRVAGLFAKEHNLPVVYRGLTTNIPESLLEECRSLHISGTKTLSSILSRRLLATSGSWLIQQSASPQSHDLLGISAENGGYVQVTSPMRRYLDIVAHWQFEAHLRGSRPPFSLDELMGTGETSIIQAARRLYRRMFLSRKFSQFYAAHAVSQLVSNPGDFESTPFEFRNMKPLLTAFLIDQEIQQSTYLSPRLIGIKELGVNGTLILRHDETFPRFEEEFPVEIQEVNEVEGQVICSLARS